MKKYFFLLIILSVVACGQQPGKAEKEYTDLKDDIFAVHDSLMDEMINANMLRRQLKTKSDHLKNNGNNIELKRAKEHLKHAHKYMMSWMHGFNKAFPDINKEDTSYTDREYRERTARLKNQEKELLKVKDAMDHSVKEAKNLLGK